MRAQVHPPLAFPGPLPRPVSSLPPPGGHYSPRVLAPRRRRGRCAPRMWWARPSLVAPRSSPGSRPARSAPRRGPRSAAPLLAVGARWGATGRVGEQRRLGRGRWTPTPPPRVTRIGPLLAALPPLPLSASLSGGDSDRGRGGRPQQRRRPSAQAPVRVLEPRERQERTS